MKKVLTVGELVNPTRTILLAQLARWQGPPLVTQGWPGPHWPNTLKCPGSCQALSVVEFTPWVWEQWMDHFGLRGKSRSGSSQAGTLGTFAGVFTPSVLTILGIILFLRLGFVVGAAGLGRALLILGIANLISVLTSFSLATIATNLRVKGGGDYYLISRTLGVEFGGALGIVLFAAQSISIAFYAIGFGEAVATIAGRRRPGSPGGGRRRGAGAVRAGLRGGRRGDPLPVRRDGHPRLPR